jgi:plastocyanin
MCPDCPDCKACSNGADCASGFCHPSTGLCSTPNCSDSVKNAAETDIDCGGPACPDCANGKLCVVSGDCQSGICYEGVCAGSLNGCTLAGSMDFGNGPVTVTFPNVNFTYAPKCIKVNAGAQVTFNGAFASHPLQGGVVNGAVMTPASSGPFAALTNSGNTKTFAMTTAGAFPYYCTFHYFGGMTGAVFVVP